MRGGPADELGADDDGASAGRLVVEVDEVLQVTGGVDPRGAVAGDEARGAWSFTGAGGEDDCLGADAVATARGW